MCQDTQDEIKCMKEYAKKNSVPIMFDETCEFICRYIREHDAKRILEIGSAIGYSAIQFALCSEDISVTTVEIDIDRAIKAIENIKKAGLSERITLINNDALAIDIEGKFDLIFIDAAKAQYVKFFEKFKKNLAKGGVIISDNLHFHGIVDDHSLTKSYSTLKLVRKIKKYVDFLKENTEFSTTFFDLGDGISVSSIKEKVDFEKCRILGKGSTATLCEISDDKSCKLFIKGYPREAVLREFRNSFLAAKKGISMPKAIELTENDGQYGIIFEKTNGTPFLDFAKTHGLENWIHDFTGIHKEFLSKNVSEGECISYKDHLMSLIGDRGKSENFEIIHKIKKLKEGTVLCHGDFHPGNIMRLDDGKCMIMDSMNLCSAPWEYDAARTFFLLEEAGCNEAASAYLKDMELTKDDVGEYLEIIALTRKFEKNEDAKCHLTVTK